MLLDQDGAKLLSKKLENRPTFLLTLVFSDSNDVALQKISMFDILFHGVETFFRIKP